MFIEVVAAILVIVVIKAFFASNWLKSKKRNYTEPGLLYFPKRIIVQLYCRITRLRNGPARTARCNDLLRGENDLERVSEEETNTSNRKKTFYFNGFAEKQEGVDADAVLLLRLSIESNKQADICLFLQVPGHGFLQHPNHPDAITCYASCDDDVYRAEGVVLEMIEPMRSWRISYHGLMRMVDVLKDPMTWRHGKNLVYVKFGFQWTYDSFSYNFTQEIDINLWSDAVSRESWNFQFLRNLKRFCENVDYCEQWGKLTGRVYVDGMEEDEDGRAMSLRGVRSSFVGMEGFHYRRYVKVIAQVENGLTLSVVAACAQHSLTHFVCGYITLPNRNPYSISWTDLRLWKHGEDEIIPNVMQFNVSAGKCNYNVVCLVKFKPQYFCGNERNGKIFECPSDIYVDSIRGNGIVEMYYRTASSRVERTVEPLFEHSNEDHSKNNLILSLSDHLCKDETLVGSKAAYLSRLLTLISCDNPTQFYSQEGFCITTHAYEQHLQENSSLKDEIENMYQALRKGNKDDVIDATKRCVSTFSDSTIPQKLICEVKENFMKLKRHSQGRFSVAVRCSPVDMYGKSAHLPSFLGVTSINQVIAAILKCWGSRFCYDAIQHRRQTGLPVIPEMSVIVQIMAEDERARGSLFSCEPKSGDPSRVIVQPYFISHKEGLNHSEKFILRRYDDDSYVVVSHVDDEQDNETTQDKCLDLQSNLLKSRCRWCLSYDDLSKLAKISQIIKSSFQNDVAIKWSISSCGKIFILRVNPIEVEAYETDYDLLHEFDSAHSIDENSFDEVLHHDMLPGVSTPLTASILFRSTILGIQNAESHIFGNNNCQSINAALKMKESRYFINHEAGIGHCGFSYFFRELAGRRDQSGKNNQRFGWKFITELVFVMNALWKNLAYEKKLSELTQSTVKMNVTNESAKIAYEKMSQHIIPNLSSALTFHIICSVKYHLLKKVLQAILLINSDGLEKTHHSDIAVIYGPSFADLPETIQLSMHRLALAITNENEEFLAMKPMKAIKWLKNNKNDLVKTLYDKFLFHHGHHCMNQCELREESWSNDQTKIITSLQSFVENVHTSNLTRNSDVNATLDQIKTPLNIFQSIALKQLIPSAQESATQFCRSKSTFIKILNVFKEGYSYLANYLKTEMKLPDEDLLFFFTHREIGKLLHKYSPQLVARSIRRRRIYYQLLNMKQNSNVGQAMSGTDQVPSFSSEARSRDQVLNGICVCPKKVTGMARMLKDETEAFLIQKDEILIVPSPDIGWTPYYHLVAGLVSEVGDISSVGAMMAAECGLPCIIDATDVTNTFKTGDLLVLDGSAGTLQHVRIAR